MEKNEEITKKITKGGMAERLWKEGRRELMRGKKIYRKYLTKKLILIREVIHEFLINLLNKIMMND